MLRGIPEDQLTEEEHFGFWKRSGKLIVVESLLRLWFKQNHKVLLFTQSRQVRNTAPIHLSITSQYTHLYLDLLVLITSRHVIPSLHPLYFKLLLNIK